ncbi:TPA_asm: hypothetical protein vir530_00015 [dsDNA virus vir530]|nr:TPA_asm: hypothetical protein vir530_00015 [dsDNA virus vir530]
MGKKERNVFGPNDIIGPGTLILKSGARIVGTVVGVFDNAVAVKLQDANMVVVVFDAIEVYIPPPDQAEGTPEAE